MRDPAGDIFITDAEVRRHLKAPIGKYHFLRSSLAKRWIKRGCLVEFDVVDEVTAISRRIDFVSHPSEWCDEQLYRAGKLTLELHKEAIEAGFDLKDASAWNIVFDGGRPMLVDLLSIETLRQKLWWAAGQFSRHFILPLSASRYSGLNCNKTFLSWRDGLPPDAARKIIGMRRFLTPYWPLMTSSTLLNDAKMSARTLQADGQISHTNIVEYRSNLDASLAWMLQRLAPANRKPSSALRGWYSYTETRNHYSAMDVESKKRFVIDALELVRPSWVLDLGCNSGEFTFLSAKFGAQVIAIDSDHDAVEKLVHRCTCEDRVSALVANIDDLPAGRGWCGKELPSLMSRIQGRCDLVLMLALIHHLAIGCSIPLERIAKFASECTNRWLIVELIDSDDPMVKSLCSQRDRQPQEFTAAIQHRAFQEAGFVVRKSVKNGTGHREMLLLEKSFI